jgi:hypothetical protein
MSKFQSNNFQSNLKGTIKMMKFNCSSKSASGQTNSNNYGESSVSWPPSLFTFFANVRAATKTAE